MDDWTSQMKEILAEEEKAMNGTEWKKSIGTQEDTCSEQLCSPFWYSVNCAQAIFFSQCWALKIPSVYLEISRQFFVLLCNWKAENEEVSQKI